VAGGDNGWGTSADGTKATGPEGFTIDLTKCPSGWSNTEGLSDASINGMKESVTYKFLGSACKASGPVTKDKVGHASDGWWSVGGGLKDIVSTAYDNDPWIKAARGWMADAGYEFNMNGNADAYFLEGSDISQWSAAEQTWKQQAIVDLSGKTKNCAWDQATSTCK
jgi:hypothetical protein